MHKILWFYILKYKIQEWNNFYLNYSKFNAILAEKKKIFGVNK